jgi:hypothetical protein
MPIEKQVSQDFPDPSEGVDSFLIWKEICCLQLIATGFAFGLPYQYSIFY